MPVRRTMGFLHTSLIPMGFFDVSEKDSRLTVYPWTGSLEIRSVAIRDEGSYKCKVSNPDKFRYSSEGRISVRESQCT